jgi:uncharacterized RDD family membrane protein YckC
MNYFLWINEAQTGPYPWAQIKALLAEKSITPETLFWKEGMTDWQPLSMLLDPGGAAAVPNPVDAQPRFFSGFWRRFGALVIDWIILFVAGHILGIAFFNFFSALGSSGLLVGLGLAVLYFGLQNSVLCGGQTPGKRLLGIEVVDAEGKSILPAHSVVRYLILGLPFFALNPAVLGPIFTTWMGLLLATVMSFWIGTITYLFLFNVPTRQTLHDRIVHTYVVRTRTKGAVTPSPFWPLHYALLALMGLGLLGMMTAAVLLMQWGPFPNLLAIQQAVQTDPHVEYASISMGKNWSFTDKGSQETDSLDVGAFWNGKPDDMDEAARSVAGTVLGKASPDEVAKQDVLLIRISYGYDIGIASASVSSTFEHSPEEWRQIVANASPP